MSSKAIGVLLGIVVAVLPLGGCGSGKATSTSHTSTAPQTTPATPATSSTAATTSSIPASNGSGTAVLPAAFTLGADGSMSPPQIAGPSDTTILLTVFSKAAHPVQIFFSTGLYLNVPPGGRASRRLTGLKNGNYSLSVDHKTLATLVVGAQPGP
jgi:hypothetical protein